MKSLWLLSATLLLACAIGCGAGGDSIPTSSTADQTLAVEQAQQQAAQEEMAQQGKR